MNSNSEFRWFYEDACNRCGLCLEECPTISLSHEGAVKDINTLIDGNAQESVAFNKCTTCNVCDLKCPNNALPYELILERFDKWRKNHGLPNFAKLGFPNESGNIWTGLRPLMEKEELELLHNWENRLGEERKEIVLTGFYTNIVPYLAQVKVLENIRSKMVGSECLWGCGGDTNKIGMLELTEQVIKLIQNQFSKMGVERIYCFMEAEAAMLEEVLPERFNAEFDFEAVPLDNLVLEKIQENEIDLEELEITVTVHDNCMSRYLDGNPQKVVRKIVKKTGCNLVEMKHSKSEALCCGWAATIPTLHGEGANNPLSTLFYLFSNLYRRLEEAEETGADAIVTSCPACYIFLSLISILSDSEMKVYHLFELVELSSGRTPPRKIEKRCWDILAVATNFMLKQIYSGEYKERFTPKSIAMDKTESLPQINKTDSKRIKTISKIYKSPLIQNKISKSLIGLLVILTINLYKLYKN